MIKILFVCLGNICRSPLAEAIFNEKVKQLGLENLLFSDSAGTSGYHTGNSPDRRTIDVARKHHVPISHTGKQLSVSLASDFDYIVAMDASNKQNILKVLGKSSDSIFLMRHFDFLFPDHDVPDPYYGNMDSFDEVFQILDRSLEEFIKYIRQEHQLTTVN
jgi:protein-tyrosine phosphatase